MDVYQQQAGSSHLEPDNWCHHVRLAYVCWGEARLRAARRALALFPLCAMARWLATTVCVARGALLEAEREIDLGLAASEHTDELQRRFAAVALYWMMGLLCLARGASVEAMNWFEQELALEARGHVYAREIAANTWYAVGVCRLRQGDATGALAAFAEARARVSRHPLARAGAAVAGQTSEPLPALLPSALPNDTLPLVVPIEAPIEVTLARAAVLAAREDAKGAATLVHAALDLAPPGNGAWTLPIEPLVAVCRDPDAWASALARLCARAM